MKNIIYYTIFSCILISCNNSSKQVDSNAESAAVEQAESSSNTKATYDRNVANFKAMFDAWSNQDVEAALNLMADNFMETGTGYGEPDRTKEEWKTQTEGMMTIMKPTLKQAIYLPGIDTVSLEMDGSVRYYGTWNFAVGEKNEDIKVYGTADFNEEGLITSLAHYADFSMTMMQIMPEEMMQQMMGGAQ
jgi:hypothetical protein